MIGLRPYEKDDAQTVTRWIKDENALQMWSAGRFADFPLSHDEFHSFYVKNKQALGFIFEEDGIPVGHFFILPLEKNNYKFGLIIVDDTKRGKGYGRKMLEYALFYAKNNLNANSVTLSVFDDNTSAYNCYKSLGFSETGVFTEYCFSGKIHKYYELCINL